MFCYVFLWINNIIYLVGTLKENIWIYQHFFQVNGTFITTEHFNKKRKQFDKYRFHENYAGYFLIKLQK